MTRSLTPGDCDTPSKGMRPRAGLGSGLIGFGLLGAILLGLAASFAGSRADAADEPEKEHATARLVANVSQFTPGKTFRLGVWFTIDEHWHIYWHSARDGGLSTQVEWQLPAGWTAGPLEWPVPKRYIDPGELISYGYEKEVLLVSEISVPADFSGDAVTLSADLSWLVCKEICLIGNAKPTLRMARGDVARGDEKPSAEVARFAAARARLPKSPQAQGISVVERFERSGDEGTWSVALTWPEGAEVPDVKNVRAFPFDAPGSRSDEGNGATEGRRTVFTFQVEIYGDEFRSDQLGVVLTWPSSPPSTVGGKGIPGEPRSIRIVRGGPSGKTVPAGPTG